MGKGKKLTTDFVIDLMFWLARGFHFVLYLGVTNPFITLVISIDWVGGLWELVLICWRAWNLRIHLIHLQVHDDLIWSTKVDNYWMIVSETSFEMISNSSLGPWFYWFLSYHLVLSLPKCWVLICVSWLYNTVCFLLCSFFSVLTS